jgi:hypothetical protein
VSRQSYHSSMLPTAPATTVRVKDARRTPGVAIGWFIVFDGTHGEELCQRAFMWDSSHDKWDALTSAGLEGISRTT